MKSTSEESFGQRYKKSQDVLTFIQGFSNYTPPRAEESVASLTALLDEILESNIQEANAMQQYRASVSSRLNALGKRKKLDELVQQIKAHVLSQYGKDSNEYSSIATILKKFYPSKKKAENNTDPAQEPVHSTSHSEASFGARIHYFGALVNTLSQFTAYAPSNPDLTLANLQSFLIQASSLNTEVAQKTQALRLAKMKRRALYADLKYRISRVKLYVKAQFGSNSNEFNLLRKL